MFGSKSHERGRFASVKVILIVGVILMSLLYTLPSYYAQESSSDLVVEPGGERTIYHSDHGLKGSIRVLEGGQLSMIQSTFTIYQDYSRQFDIHISRGGTLVMKGSSITSDLAIDIYMEEGSSLIVKNSSVNIPGKLSGELQFLEIYDSDVHFEEVNLGSAEGTLVNSVLTASSTVFSMEDGEFVESIFDTDMVIHQGYIYMKGSSVRNIDVREEATVEVYRKLRVQVTDLAGIPIGESSIEVIEQRSGILIDQGETDADGAWTSYVYCEILSGSTSHYEGNLVIRGRYEDREITTSVSFPPIGNEDAGLEEIILGKVVELEFQEVLSPSIHYQTSNNDLRLDNTDEMRIRSYPNEGIHNHVVQGNMILAGTSRLTVESGLSLKVIQGEKYHRIELRDESSLILKNGAGLISDRPLNVYLYDDSSIKIQGGAAEMGVIYSSDGSSLMVKEGELKMESMYVQGRMCNFTHSSISGYHLSLSSSSTNIEGTEINTETDITIDSQDVHIHDSSFQSSLTIGGDDTVQISDVRAPKITAMQGTIVERYWSLELSILNSEDRYVPASTVDIIHINGTIEETVITEYVHRGKLVTRLPSEIITEEGVEFVGNYLIRGEKTLNGDRVYSEETRLALEDETKAVLRYWQTFPYSLNLEYEIESTSLDTNESFVIEGFVYYEGADLEVGYAEVNITISGVPHLNWNVRTDDRGNFRVTCNAPEYPGTYRVNIEVYDEEMHMSAQASEEIVVGDEERHGVREFLFESTIGVSITILLIIVLLGTAYVIAFAPYRKGLPKADTPSRDLVRWAEEVLNKR